METQQNHTDQHSTAVPSSFHLFRSFFIAGYESACHVNHAKIRLDMVASTQHDVQVENDYALLRTVGIRCARDAVRWHLIDKGGHYDFSSFLPMLKASLKQGIQVIWDLFHYGLPDDLDLFQPSFVDRFARYCEAIARVIADHTDETPYYTPINEVSFFPWAVGRGIMHPFAIDRDDAVKFQLVRAAIAGTERLWQVDRRARVLYGEPVIHVIAPRGRPDLAKAAARQRASQFDAWDMLAGELHPELGGHARYLDLVGINYYHSNQWEHPNGRLRWEDEPRDERWLPFHKIIAEIYDRYHRPCFVAETSHFGSGRARWVKEIAEEVHKAHQIGVPVGGICLYPILDRHDWDNPSHWHNSGLWDFEHTDGKLVRVLNDEYAAELRRAQRLFAPV